MGLPQADVLVVEDDAEINRLVGAYVQISGCHYRSALNGDSALREYRSHKPDVVILDVMLPDVDGFEICRRVRAEQNGTPVVVIMLTALTDEASRQKGLSCGADEYLTKPFDPDRLIATLGKYQKRIEHKQ
jgi:DNA-binding response OmpR family regulator